MSNEIDKFNLDISVFGLGMVFVPKPGIQSEVFFSEADELFYGGAAGGGSGITHIPLDGLYSYDRGVFTLLEKITVGDPLSFESLERSPLSVLCNTALITNEPGWLDTSCGPSYPIIGYRDA